MFTVERDGRLIRLTFAGKVDREEAAQSFAQITEAATEIAGDFYVLADLRRFELFPPESRHVMIQVQQICRRLGLARSAVILNGAMTAGQLKLFARESGIVNGERYIDAQLQDNWEKVALAWLLDSVEPELAESDQEAVADRAAR